MSYDITFDGSLVDNRDLPQITTSSSLSKTTTFNASGSQFEMNGTGSFPINIFLGNTAIFPQGGSGSYNGNGTADFVTSAGQVLVIQFLSQGNGVPLNIVIQVGSNWGSNPEIYARWFDGSNNPVGGFVYTNFSVGVGTLINFTSSAPSGASYLQVQTGSPFSGAAQFDYIRCFVTTSSSVSITPSTLVNGANKTGGVATTATVTTVQDGAPSASGPAKLFGVEVKDGGVTKARAKFLPAADNTEEAVADVKDVKIITADNTALTVEATGLGGPEKLQSGTSITVEDMTEQTENP